MSILDAKVMSLQGFERGARRLMGAAAAGAAIVGLAFHGGLLSMMPQYDAQSWYLVSEHAGFVVTSVVADEAACRKLEKASAACYSGRRMQSRPAVGRR